MARRGCMFNPALALSEVQARPQEEPFAPDSRAVQPALPARRPGHPPKSTGWELRLLLYL